MDSSRTAYCVLSTYELASFPQWWGVDPERVYFTPYCFTLTDAELAAPTSTEGGVFAGGDSLRDYGPLLEAARQLPFQLNVASRALSAVPDNLPPNVHAKPASHNEFVDLMRHASVVVVPIKAGTDRGAGQTTYLNAMALGKLVITTDIPAVHDYIDHGSTGLIVPPGDPESIADALAWALDPSHQSEVDEIAARARAVALSRYRPVDYFRRLLHVVDEVTSAVA
jgi:glycosyltransferase involved in cell wall biosynthesis